jgi:hypothetical protein
MEIQRPDLEPARKQPGLDSAPPTRKRISKKCLHRYSATVNRPVSFPHFPAPFLNLILTLPRIQTRFQFRAPVSRASIPASQSKLPSRCQSPELRRNRDPGGLV